jgi:hypothetical protein
VAAGARAWSKNLDDSGKVVPVVDGPPLAPELDLRVDQELARFDS